MTDAQKIIEIRRTRWDRQGRKSSPVAAAHLVENNKPVDCYDEIALEYIERLECKSDDRVLEVGCGSGCLLLAIKPSVKEIVGTDFSQAMLQHLEGSGVETHWCEANELPFPDASFDKVYCHGVVQYFPDEAYAIQAFDEMMRVCKAGGNVLIGDIVNKRLREEYRREGIRTNHWGPIRYPLYLGRKVLQSVYYRWKYGTAARSEILFLDPSFFRSYFASKGWRWLPLLETVVGKPASFLKYRYDILVHKDEMAGKKKKNSDHI